MTKIAVLPGDGIGPEIVRATTAVLRAACVQTGAQIDLVELPIGLSALNSHGDTIPKDTEATIAASDGVILGPVTSHVYDIFDPSRRNPSAYLRKRFDLYANIRPARSRGRVQRIPGDIDLVVVRENTEGFYADRNVLDGNGELRPSEDTVVSVRVITRKACTRIAEQAFSLARARGLKRRVSAVHKANVLRRGDGLFLECCRDVAAQYPDITFDDFHIDAMAAELILRAEEFDVIVSTNMFGDILSDEAAALVGGLGLAPGLNVGRHLVVAQAVHGSAPTIAGKGIANPAAEMLSAAMLLEWLGRTRNSRPLRQTGALIEDAVSRVITAGEPLTPDLNGNATTVEFTRAVELSLGGDS